jgi:hypothetical protein
MPVCIFFLFQQRKIINFCAECAFGAILELFKRFYKYFKAWLKNNLPKPSGGAAPLAHRAIGCILPMTSEAKSQPIAQCARDAAPPLETSRGASF